MGFAATLTRKTKWDLLLGRLHTEWQGGGRCHCMVEEEGIPPYLWDLSKATRSRGGDAVEEAAGMKSGVGYD